MTKQPLALLESFVVFPLVRLTNWSYIVDVEAHFIKRQVIILATYLTWSNYPVKTR